MHDVKSSSNSSVTILLNFVSLSNNVASVIPQLNIAFASLKGGLEPGAAGCGPCTAMITYIYWYCVF